ncbi:NAD(P)/FAD-dependent oxidoreductase [Oerskovia sp. Root22]|uniref:dihydrolipoyl dehydrogenase family protein n=1 Tax=Oerskovia sp. Root22 TaxID=1736494 RepID=UPI0006F3C1F6|nr:NAD(P)/FAD-dependent oxidoreductase [Oerskovia sp. Root22]KRC37549.1 pyridine nucleotide-disulfide oxidoreductase [Oerskovia sp. Root22]
MSSSDPRTQATPDETFDVIVIGGGPVGENAADRASRTGLSVAVVEAELVGGECSYWACMPSKALLRPGAALAAARAVPGVEASPTLDPAPILARRDEMVSHWDDSGQVQWLDGAGISLVRGLGRLVGPRLVEVSPEDPDADVDDLPATRLLAARHAVIVATGSVPVLPDTPGLAETDPWSSREATSVQDVPASLVVIGGGVVGVEMATAFTDLGSKVTLLSRGRLLGRSEPFASEAVAAGLRAIGVDVRLGVSVTGATSLPDGRARLAYDGPQGRGSVAGAQVLVATGRVPRTGDLGVEAVGLEPGKGLAVDDQLEVQGVEGGWLFACGDVTGRVATTHQGKYEGRVVGDVVAARFGKVRPEEARAAGASGSAGEAPEPWSRYAATADHGAKTQVVFTRPEVASVGLTEAEAKKAGLPVRAVSYKLGSVSGAVLVAEGYEGTAQIVVDTERQVIVGATFVGPDAAEMLHAATIAIVGQVPLARLWHAVPAYPTISEVWLRLLETYGL